MLPLDVAQPHLRWVWVTGRHPERKACQRRQIVDLVLIWTSHLPQSTLMGDQMVKVLVGGGKGKIPIGPVYFTRDYVLPGWFRNKTYPQGRRGVVLREHTLFGKVTHVDLRLPDGEFLPEVPIDYIRTE
jgi:hypothetical protein